VSAGASLPSAASMAPVELKCGRGAVRAREGNGSLLWAASHLLCEAQRKERRGPDLGRRVRPWPGDGTAGPGGSARGRVPRGKNGVPQAHRARAV
jgi:hypothetical protein